MQGFDKRYLVAKLLTRKGHILKNSTKPIKSNPENIQKTIFR